MQVSRPYMSASLVELTAIVEDDDCSANVRALIADELRHRTTKGARRLLAHLEGGAIGSVPRPSSAGGERGRGVAEPAVVGLCSDERLAILRETYTEGAELLARWGLTTAIPEPLFEIVLEWWRSAVGEDPDHLGRSRSRLEEDVAKLRSLGSVWGGDARVT